MKHFHKDRRQLEDPRNQRQRRSVKLLRVLQGKTECKATREQGTILRECFEEIRRDGLNGGRVTIPSGVHLAASDPLKKTTSLTVHLGPAGYHNDFRAELIASDYVEGEYYGQLVCQKFPHMS